MATKTETSLTNLVINYLSESDYNSAVSAGTINENELYMTPTQATTDTKNTAGSTNTSNKIYLIGATSQAANPQTYSHDTAYVGTDGCLYSNSTKVSVDGHTHNYAGSSSAGGSATSADKLDSSAGSSTQPIYFSSGKPTACSYTLGKSVPSDAVFTDTTYTSLKNPYSLIIQGNGTTLTNGTYDGSAAKTVNITVSSLGLTASTAELNYCKGVTNAIQTQLDGTVKLSGDQTIAGVKTFSSNIVANAAINVVDSELETLYTSLQAI